MSTTYLSWQCWIRHRRMTTPSGWTFCIPSPRMTRIPVLPVHPWSWWRQWCWTFRPRNSHYRLHHRCSGRTSAWACWTAVAACDDDYDGGGRQNPMVTEIGGVTWTCPPTNRCRVAAVEELVARRSRRHCHCCSWQSAGLCCNRSSCVVRNDICPTTGKLSDTDRTLVGPPDRCLRYCVSSPYPLKMKIRKIRENHCI